MDHNSGNCRFGFMATDSGYIRIPPGDIFGLAGYAGDGDIPVELLYRLPEWCCYIDCYEKQYGPSPLAGFFVHLERDTKDGRHELRLLLDMGEQNRIFPLIVHISGKKRVSDMFTGFVDESERVAKLQWAKLLKDFGESKEPVAQFFSKMAGPHMSLILYLCPTSPEFRDARGSDRFPARASSSPSPSLSGDSNLPGFPGAGRRFQIWRSFEVNLIALWRQVHKAGL